MGETSPHETLLQPDTACHHLMPALGKGLESSEPRPEGVGRDRAVHGCWTCFLCPGPRCSLLCKKQVISEILSLPDSRVLRVGSTLCLSVGVGVKGPSLRKWGQPPTPGGLQVGRARLAAPYSTEEMDGDSRGLPFICFLLGWEGATGQLRRAGESTGQ